MTAVGERLLRREDAPILTGEARYVDDLDVPGALHVTLVRSPHAHARIGSIDATAAKAMPGVVGVYTAADLQGAFAGPLPCAWPVTPDMKNPPHFPLASGKAAYVGDAVAAVVATSKSAAQDAAGEVVVDYEVLPAVTDLEDALSDRVVIHEDLGTNASYTWALPEPEGIDDAIANAAHVVKERYIQQRLIPAAMEPRGVCVVPAPAGGDYIVYSATQVPHILKIMLALTMGVSEAKIRVIAPAVGGGFGSKLNVYAEEALCFALAAKLRKPVRWTEERSEGAYSTIQGRGQIQDIELAADQSGKLKAIRVRLIGDMGAYLQLVTPGIPLLGAFLYHGVYHADMYSFSCTSVFTTMTPTDAYRGAGRPEATYAIERAMDTLARQVGVDPAEIRRRNYIAPFVFPNYTSPAGLAFDSGNYEGSLDKALDLVDYDGLRKQQAERRGEGGKHLGIGLSTYVEMCGL
ncbi:MAG: xanthine dehydrogenase family protein molybdopterin-binding subunit, partial [Acidimicrobiia bacterium]